jgi:hypothetical protein
VELIWTAYTYMKQNKETSYNCFTWGVDGLEGERWWGDLTNGIVIMNSPALCIEFILIKNKNK